MGDHWRTRGRLDQLTWKTPRTIARATLHDRIKLTDHILGGTLRFSDGRRVAARFRLEEEHEQIADLANYVRTSWENQAAPNASAQMVAAWRATAEVPDFGTEAAATFDCPRVGGAPGAAGPRPATVAALSAMLQGGNRNVRDLIAAYEGLTPGASPADAVNTMVSAYCPVVAASGAPTYRKFAEIRRFSMEVAAAVSPQAAAPM